MFKNEIKCATIESVFFFLHGGRHQKSVRIKAMPALLTVYLKKTLKNVK